MRIYIAACIARVTKQQESKKQKKLYIKQNSKEINETKQSKKYFSMSVTKSSVCMYYYVPAIIII